MTYTNKIRTVFGIASFCILPLAFAQEPALTDANLKVVQAITSSPEEDPLASPVGIAFLSENDILVIEKSTGRVRRIINGVLQQDNVLDLSVGTANEQGLTSITKSPNFTTDNYIYLSYVNSSVAGIDNETGDENRVSRFKWNGTNLVNEEIIFTAVNRNALHIGGVTVFGPPNLSPGDQKLFIGLGDQVQTYKTANNPDGSAPDYMSSIIRLNQDGSIPAGLDKGPFYDIAGNNPTLQAMYAYGIRNIFGIDFDPVTNHLWDTENGEYIYDEINIVRPGFNSGWLKTMGPEARSDSQGTHPTVSAPETYVQFGGLGNYEDPVFSWRRPNGVTAVKFLNTEVYGEEYKNKALVGSYNIWLPIDDGGKVFIFELNENSDSAMNRTSFKLTGDLADKVHDYPFGSEEPPADDDSQIVFGSQLGSVTSIDLSPEGYIYFTSFSKNTIYKVIPKIASVEDWNLFY